MNARAVAALSAPCGRALAGVFAVAALVLVSEPYSQAQQFGGSTAPPMITAPVSDTNLVRLPGNVRPEANAVNDRGIVPDTLPMEHMILELRRSPAQEQALRQLIDQLHDPASPNYHKWLTPDQFGAQFGPAASDTQKVTGWLQSHGFRVNPVYPSGMAVDFSGTAGQVRTAFHTEIRNIMARGALHIANMSDPQIPAAAAARVSQSRLPILPRSTTSTRYSRPATPARTRAYT